MTSVIQLSAAIELDPATAIARFEEWTKTNPYAPYHLARRPEGEPRLYSTDRTDATYAGFVAGFAASGAGSIKDQFEAWAKSKTAHPGRYFSLEPSPYFNYAFYKSSTTQHAYEGFVAAYEKRLEAKIPVHSLIETGSEKRELFELRTALAEERARNAQLTEELAQFQRLENPELLYKALQYQGFPARLPERWFSHLASRADDSLLTKKTA